MFSVVHNDTAILNHKIIFLSIAPSVVGIYLLMNAITWAQTTVYWNINDVMLFRSSQYWNTEMDYMYNCPILIIYQYLGHTYTYRTHFGNIPADKKPHFYSIDN